MQLSYPIRLALAVVAAVASVAGGSSPAPSPDAASPTALRTVDATLSRDAMERTVEVAEIEGAVDARTTQLTAQSAAIAQAAAELAAQRAAQQQAAQKASQKPTQVSSAAVSTSGTDPRSIARQIMLSQYGWGADQFTCFDNIITRESNWNVTATNPSSGAYGIPQALPGSKMATVAADWRTNPATQIIWALGYVQSRYSTPCGAWAFKSAHGWY